MEKYSDEAPEGFILLSDAFDQRQRCSLLFLTLCNRAGGKKEAAYAGLGEREPWGRVGWSCRAVPI